MSSSSGNALLIEFSIVRSEGGADCQRILDAAKQEPDRGPVPKTEENGGWTSMSVMV